MTKTIELWGDEIPFRCAEDPFVPFMETHLLDGSQTRGAVLVCPGGGYAHRADHEADPIARRFNQAGWHGFVVHYRTVPSRHPAPIVDASQAIRLIRHNAHQWNVDPNRIAVLGFSAGGHLACSTGVHARLAAEHTPQPSDGISGKPDAMILCYPVITSGTHAHEGSFNTLLAEDADHEMLELMSLERHVSRETPPTFLWHTADDQAVPVENSLLLAQSLRRCDVPFELHVYPHGPHGMGLAEDDRHVGTWPALACEWLEQLGW